MAGLDKLREMRTEAIDGAARAVGDALKARSLPDTEAAAERVRGHMDEAVKIVRILAREGEDK